MHASPEAHGPQADLLGGLNLGPLPVVCRPCRWGGGAARRQRTSVDRLVEVLAVSTPRRYVSERSCERASKRAVIARRHASCQSHGDAKTKGRTVGAPTEPAARMAAVLTTARMATSATRMYVRAEV